MFNVGQIAFTERRQRQRAAARFVSVVDTWPFQTTRPESGPNLLDWKLSGLRAPLAGEWLVRTWMELFNLVCGGSFVGGFWVTLWSGAIEFFWQNFKFQQNGWNFPNLKWKQNTSNQTIHEFRVKSTPGNAVIKLALSLVEIIAITQTGENLCFCKQGKSWAQNFYVCFSWFPLTSTWPRFAARENLLELFAISFFRVSVSLLAYSETDIFYEYYFNLKLKKWLQLTWYAKDEVLQSVPS